MIVVQVDSLSAFCGWLWPFLEQNGWLVAFNRKFRMESRCKHDVELYLRLVLSADRRTFSNRLVQLNFLEKNWENAECVNLIIKTKFNVKFAISTLLNFLWTVMKNVLKEVRKKYSWSPPVDIQTKRNHCKSLYF